MRIYTGTNGMDIISLDVTETSKGYKVTPESAVNETHPEVKLDYWLWGWQRFIKKTDAHWHPTRIMAIQWIREIEKCAVEYARAEVTRAQAKLKKRVSDLAALDELHGVVFADDECGAK